MLGPGKYDNKVHLQNLREKFQKGIDRKKAVSYFQSQLLQEEKEEKPQNFPELMRRISPGPGQYSMQESLINQKTFHNPAQAVAPFNQLEKKMVGEYDKI